MEYTQKIPRKFLYPRENNGVYRNKSVIISIPFRNVFIMTLRELLEKITEQRLTGILAKKSGLQRKPGYGNYGPTGPYITHRSIKGRLKPVVPHRIGKDPIYKGQPNTPTRLPGQPKLPKE
jgi:hypothetical protein